MPTNPQELAAIVAQVLKVKGKGEGKGDGRSEKANGSESKGKGKGKGKDGAATVVGAKAGGQWDKHKSLYTCPLCTAEHSNPDYDTTGGCRICEEAICTTAYGKGQG